MELKKGFYIIGRDKDNEPFTFGSIISYFETLKEAIEERDNQIDMYFMENIEIHILEIEGD